MVSRLVLNLRAESRSAASSDPSAIEFADGDEKLGRRASALTSILSLPDSTMFGLDTLQTTHTTLYTNSPPSSPHPPFDPLKGYV